MATENDKVNAGALATLVAVGTASMVGISLAVNALVRHEVGSVGAVRDERGGIAYRDLKSEQLERLSAPAARTDGGAGHVSIPIERAMNLVLFDLKRNPWSATPAPPPDAGADAAVEIADAGADAQTAPEADAGTAPEPPARVPLSPSTPPPTSEKPVAPAPRPSAVPAAPPAPAPPTPATPTAAAPTAPPAAPASPTPPATP